jgi:hypothetical protein
MGWRRGSWQDEYHEIRHKNPPLDRVQTVRYCLIVAEKGQQPEPSKEVRWCDEKQSETIQTLTEKYGSCPEII